MEAGADSFLPKPIEAIRLLDVIGELCAEQAPRPKAPAPVRDAIPLTASVSVLNFDTIALLEELGSQSDFMEKLIEGFLSDNQQILRRLEYDADRMPAAEMRALLHAMKGSVSSVGADRLTQICTRVSRLSDAELRAQSGKLVKNIRDEFDAVRNSLADYLSKTKRTTG
jgi:HPt (histidine-containing phosphotransfer) domain-containing protein